MASKPVTPKRYGASTSCWQRLKARPAPTARKPNVCKPTWRLRRRVGCGPIPIWLR
jgi:hypothetical protein